jgi:hypothetical protein
MAKKFLNRDAILQAQDIKKEELFIPEWDGTVIIKGLTAADRDKYEAKLIVQKGKNTTVNMKNARARLVMMSVVDESGAQLFTEADIAALGQKSAAVLDRIFDVASRLSGISDEDLEELSKNSESDPSED